MEDLAIKKKMAIKCFIYGCRKFKNGQKCHTFGVPKNPDQFQKWAEAVKPYSNGKTLQSQHRICHKHFKPGDLENYFVHLIQGTEVKIERHRPDLKKGAIPSIFPSQKKEQTWKNGPKTIYDGKIRKATVKKSSVLQTPATPPNLANSIELPLVVEDTNLNIAEDEQAVAAEIGGSEYQVPEILTWSHKMAPNEDLSPDKQVPLDKEPSVCINWDALPLPEEIGSLLCDIGSRKISSKSDFNMNFLKKNCLALPERLKPSPMQQITNGTDNMIENTSVQSPNNIFSPILSTSGKSVVTDVISSVVTKSTSELSHKSISELPLANGITSTSQSALKKTDSTKIHTMHRAMQPPKIHSSQLLVDVSEPHPKPFAVHKSNRATARRTSRADVEDTPVSFQEFQRKFKNLELGSSMWAAHNNQSCIFFSLMTHGFRTAPRVEKIVMYEGTMRPRVFLRSTEVRVPSVSGKDSKSLLAVFNVLCDVEELRLCLGTNRADGTFSASSDCDIFLDSVKLSRCRACRKEREDEYKRKRHLEYQDTRSARKKK